MFKLKHSKIAVIGLGYVGLPLAVAFGRRYPTVGFDINAKRIAELKNAVDHTLEVCSDEIKQAAQLTYTTELSQICASNVYIVTVPTPIDHYKKPDLAPLIRASEMVASVLKKGDTVIFESTVYPGATEEDCVPLLQKSGLEFNIDFFVGYSPERINPGDKTHRLSDIVKVTSGSTPKCAKFVDDLYKSIIRAGTHPAASIRVAEAAKVIENTQRDLNIALVNELAKLFSKMDIDTQAVLEAAGSKWNFLPFKPGLVGGHCIGVDPYYLTHKAQSIGFFPGVILAGRRINDSMGAYVAREVIRLMIQKRINAAEAKVLIMGFAFKENCPDLRNTRVIDIVSALANYSLQVDIFDPLVNAEEVSAEYHIELVKEPQANYYDAIILAVAHDEFTKLSIEDIRRFGSEEHIVYDVKYLFPKHLTDGRL